MAHTHDEHESDDEPRYTVGELRSALEKYHRELVNSGTRSRETIHTYVIHPDRFLRYVDGTFKP
jgi:hypothetical protein